MKGKLYYILSLTHNDPNHLVWWRENASGYCTRLDWAGKYTEELITEHPPYYNNGKDTKAILCEDVLSMVVQCVPKDDDKVCRKLSEMDITL